MKKFMYVLLIYLLFNSVEVSAIEFTNLSNITNDLNYAENQIFKRNYRNNNIETRLEKLETEVYGAIQSGSIDGRISNLKKAVTNSSLGGYGLNNLSKFTNLLSEGISSYNYSIGTNNRYPYYYGRNNYSNRIYPNHHKHHHTNRIYPHNYYRNSKPDNSNYSTNYSIGTSVKILDD